MRNVVLKKVMIDGINAFTGIQQRSYIVFVVNHETHYIKMDYNGAFVTFWDFYNLCLSDADIREELKYGINQQMHRRCPANVCLQISASGAKDLELRCYDCKHTDFIPYFKGRVEAKIHISCYNKIEPYFNIWSGDIAAMLYAIEPYGFTANAARCIENGKFRYIKKNSNIKYIDPNQVSNKTISRYNVNDIRFDCMMLSTKDGLNLRELANSTPLPKCPHQIK